MDIKSHYNSHRHFYRYLTISIFVTLIDFIVSRVCEFFIPEVIISNTIGVVLGFLIQYLLTSRHVYNQKDMVTFFKLLTTFLLGLILANTIVELFRNYIFKGDDSFFVFLISKGFSIVIPFFIMYFIRKKWIGQGGKV